MLSTPLGMPAPQRCHPQTPRYESRERELRAAIVAAIEERQAPTQLAPKLHALAIQLELMGHYCQANELWQMERQIHEAAFGRGEGLTNWAHRNLARNSEVILRKDWACHLYEQLLADYEAKFGIYHPFSAEGTERFAHFHETQENDATARNLIARSRQIYMNLFQNDSDNMLVAERNLRLGRFYMKERNYAAALPYLVAAKEAFERRFHPDHLLMANIYSDVANVHTHTCNFTEAEPLFRQALEIFVKHYGECDWTVGDVLNDYAEMLQRAGRIPEALQAEARVESINRRWRQIVQSRNNLM